MKIEIIGLPGVGKTYIFERLQKKYPAVNAYCYVSDDHVKNHFLADVLFYVQNPILTVLSFLQPLRWHIITRLKRLARRRAAYKRAQPTIFYHYGLLQQVLEIKIAFDRANGCIPWYGYAKAYCVSDCYIHITDEIASTARRECERIDRRFTYDEKRLTEKYAMCENMIADVRKLYPRFHVFDIRDYETMDALIDALYGLLMGMLEREDLS